MATPKTRAPTRDSDPRKCGLRFEPRKTWTQKTHTPKNLDQEKPGPRNLDHEPKACVRRFSSKQFFKKFRHFHRKTPVLESPFTEVAGLKACNFIKKRLQSGADLEGVTGHPPFFRHDFTEPNFGNRVVVPNLSENIYY